MDRAWFLNCFIQSSSKSDIEGRASYERDQSHAPANVKPKDIPSRPSKPQQFPSIVEELISWQQRRGFYSISVSSSLGSVLRSSTRRILDVRHSVSSSSNGLVARLAVPDSDRVSLDSCLSAECADVFGMLSDFHLLNLLSEGGTVSVV